MKKSIYVLALTLVIATLVISSTASVPLIRNTSDTDNSVSDYDTSSAPNNDDSFIQRLKRLLTGEIIDIDISDNAAINSSKIDGVPSHDHDERYYTQAEVDALIDNVTGGIQQRVFAGIEFLVTIDTSSCAHFYVPAVLNLSNINVSASGIVIEADIAHLSIRGQPLWFNDITSSIEGSKTKISLECAVWDGSAWETMSAPNDKVQISWTVVEHFP